MASHNLKPANSGRLTNLRQRERERDEIAAEYDYYFVWAENDECSFNCDLFSAVADADATKFELRLLSISVVCVCVIHSTLTHPILKSRFFVFCHRAPVLFLVSSVLFFRVFIKMNGAVENYEPREKTLNLYFFLLSQCSSSETKICVSRADTHTHTRTHIINII